MKYEIGSVERDSSECEALAALCFASYDMPPFSVRWEIYKSLEDHGQFKLFVARDDNAIVGFSMYTIQPHVHHAQVVAQNTMLCVHPDKRNRGVGANLINEATIWMHEHGCTHIVHHHNIIEDTIPLFAKMGFRLVELAYVKELN